MDSFFSGDVPNRFSLFSASHITMIILYLIMIVTLVISYRKLAANQTLTNFLRWLFAGILFISVSSYHMWMASNDTWLLGHSLPLHITSLSGFLAIYALISFNKRLIRVTFFIGFLSTGLAVMTPDLAYDFPHYRYWQFFLHHMIVSVSSLYLVLVTDIQITLKHLFTIFGGLLVYAFIIGVFVNPTLDANYLFLSRPPVNETIINYLGSGPIYIVSLVFIGFFAFLLSFGFYQFVKGFKQK
ncbi:TIGR02206 family membrane protein [Allobacillus sp. GCM10007491]|uniref:TIGR02206 family membrane protein n=1 Tax=Allobacillus saliphilus TaxID=2912308 RepID=A0A941CRL1_9BACI|nr:TIGR02206 family membrane protein [Allobacillus saliphilus]MBR7552598.1 TIGR02206 family membrane protein [Allobacillus saliphilus]